MVCGGSKGFFRSIVGFQWERSKTLSILSVEKRFDICLAPLTGILMVFASPQRLPWQRFSSTAERLSKIPFFEDILKTISVTKVFFSFLDQDPSTSSQ